MEKTGGIERLTEIREVNKKKLGKRRKGVEGLKDVRIGVFSFRGG